MMERIQKKRERLFMTNKKHLVYILQCNDGTFYTGYTNDLKRRLRMHEAGKGAKYTRGRSPFKVVYTERFSTKAEAMQREYAIKRLRRADKLLLIKTQESSDYHERSK